MAGCGDHWLGIRYPDRIVCVRHRCKAWRCEYCAGIKRRRVCARAFAGNPNKFLTLTCRPGTLGTPNEAARAMVRAFELLVKRIKRHYELKALPYMRFTEAHKNGSPHLHILLRAPFLEAAWISDQWQDITGSFVIKIKAVENTEHLARYLAKYLTKELHHFEGTKRFHSSRDWDLAPAEPVAKVERPIEIRAWPQLPRASFLAQCKQAGWAISQATPDRIEATAPYPGAVPPLWYATVDLAELDLPRKRKGVPNAQQQPP